MGNTGRPSTGCARCRKRRIKCDERRPGCHRCEKLGEDCPGYTHSFWIFRDENDTARRRALRNNRVKENSSTVTIGEDESLPTTILIKPGKPDLSNPNNGLIRTATLRNGKDQALTTIQPALNVDFEFRSICLFMETFTLDASTEGDDPAYLDFLPGMYSGTQTDPSLKKAVKALALSNFANRYHAKDVASTALATYGDALSTLGKSLTNPATASSDSVLAAAYLLGLYELMCHPKMAPIGGAGWSNHILGLLELVQFRWSKQSKPGKARYLFHTVHEPILIGLMMAYEPPPAGSMRFILAQDYPEGLGAKIALVFFCKTVEVRSRLQRGGYIKVPATIDEARHLNTIIDEADALARSQSFENWVVNEPRWHIVSFQPPSTSKTGKYAFSSHVIGHYWIHHWTAMMSLKKSIIDSLVAKEAAEIKVEEPTNFQARLKSLKDSIESNADLILGAVDYCLNGYHQSHAPDHGIFGSSQVRTGASSVGALGLFWPLGAIKHSPFTNSSQKEIATAVLKKIGSDLSIAQALLHVP